MAHAAPVGSRSPAPARPRTSMDDVLVMEVVDPIENVVEHPARLLVRHAPRRHDVVEQLAPGHVLLDEEYVARAVDDLEQPDDVRVAHAREDVDLALHALH